MSLFSKLNFLEDISNHCKFPILLGFTEQEIRENFMDDLTK